MASGKFILNILIGIFYKQILSYGLGTKWKKLSSSQLRSLENQKEIEIDP